MKIRLEPNTVHLTPVKVLSDKKFKSDLIIPGKVVGGQAVDYDDDRMHVAHPIRFYRVLADASKELDGKLVMAYQSQVLTAQSGVKTIHIAMRAAIIAVCELEKGKEIEEEFKIY